MTLTFNPASCGHDLHAKVKGQRSVGSEDGVKTITDGRTDGRTIGNDCIRLPHVVTQSVIISFDVIYLNILRICGRSN